MTVLVWVQHLLGTGHLRRALGLAQAVARHGLPVVVASGGPPTAFAVPAGVRLVQLPPVTAGPGGFTDPRGAGGAPWTEADRRARAARFQDLVASVAPSVLVTEMFPFGRRMFRDEPLPAILQVKGRGGRIVCSVRDILVAKDDQRKVAEMAATAEQWFDAVLVHGDERFVPFGHTFPLASRLAGRLHHTGFIVDRPLAPAGDRSGGDVLVSAGGGRVGLRLLDAAAAARGLTRLAAQPWRLVGGHALAPADRTRLAERLGRPGATHAHLPDLALRLGACRLSVSQAGYNTVVEALMAGAPMVLVPYAEGGESEQATRAAALAALGRAELVAEDGLTPAALAAAIDRAARQDVSIGRDWSFDGAERSAALLVELGALTMKLWWRDDDAGPDDDRLDRLLALATRRQVPIMLAVVPAWLHPSTVRRILDCPLASVAQHGYAHVDHGSADGRKCELAAKRSQAVLDKELVDGAQVLELGFGGRFRPVMVPPWNRIEVVVSQRLSRLGYAGLSTFGTPRSESAATGLIQRNADLDLIRWREGRRPMSADEIVASVDRMERPVIGLLTHHAVTDDAGFAALDEALARLLERPATRFIDMDELFGALRAGGWR